MKHAQSTAARRIASKTNLGEKLCPTHSQTLKCASTKPRLRTDLQILNSINTSIRDDSSRSQSPETTCAALTRKLNLYIEYKPRSGQSSHSDGRTEFMSLPQISQTNGFKLKKAFIFQDSKCHHLRAVTGARSQRCGASKERTSCHS